jgi:hypothetical protein
MSQSVAPTAQADAERFEETTDQAIATCGGDVRAALRAMIVANEYLESEVCELMQAVSHAYPMQSHLVCARRNCCNNRTRTWDYQKLLRGHHQYEPGPSAERGGYNGRLGQNIGQAAQFRPQRYFSSLAP